MSNPAPKILFVDDEAAVLEGFRRNIERQRPDWAVFFETDPEAALARFIEDAIDVVVSDLRMPGLDGLGLVERMRASGPSSAAYILLTGDPDLASAIAAINRAEIFRFFTKPCPPELLHEGIEAAIARAQEQESAPEGSRIGVHALDSLPTGYLVVDGDGRIQFANRAARILLEEADGLFEGPGRICRAHERETNLALIAAIASATTSPGTDIESGTALHVERLEPRRPLAVHVLPLGQEGTAPRPVALMISDPDRHAIAGPDTLTSLYGLSKGEAKIAHALATGESLEAAAEMSGVTLSTARTYLKNAFSKTGTARQPELVRLVLTIPVSLNRKPPKQDGGI